MKRVDDSLTMHRLSTSTR